MPAHRWLAAGQPGAGSTETLPPPTPPHMAHRLPLWLAAAPCRPSRSPRPAPPGLGPALLSADPHPAHPSPAPARRALAPRRPQPPAPPPALPSKALAVGRPRWHRSQAWRLSPRPRMSHREGALCSWPFQGAPGTAACSLGRRLRQARRPGCTRASISAHFPPKPLAADPHCPSELPYKTPRKPNSPHITACQWLCSVDRSSTPSVPAALPPGSCPHV